MEERKAALVEALAAKCQALLDAEHSAAADAAADGAAAIEVGGNVWLLWGEWIGRLGAIREQCRLWRCSARTPCPVCMRIGMSKGGRAGACEACKGSLWGSTHATGSNPDVQCRRGFENAQKCGMQDTFEDTFLELRKWVDTQADAAHAVLHARREARAGRLAGALKALEKASFLKVRRWLAEMHVCDFAGGGWGAGRDTVCWEWTLGMLWSRCPVTTRS